MPELKNTGRNQEASLARSRSRIYALLSTVFLRQPDLELVKLYRTVSEMLVDLPGINKVWGFMESRKSNSAEDIVLELSGSFTKLFRGMVPTIPPPYESLYKGESLFGETTCRVLKRYNRYGLKLNEEYKGEPPDYLGFELDFMRLLCQREADAWENGDIEILRNLLDAEKSFLEEHLLTWVGRFQEVIEKYDDIGFYSGWYIFTLDWLDQDYMHIMQR